MLNFGGGEASFRSKCFFLGSTSFHLVSRHSRCQEHALTNGPSVLNDFFGGENEPFTDKEIYQNTKNTPETNIPVGKAYFISGAMLV